MIKRILNPDLYHGHKKKKNFFEGWYYKLTDASKTYSIAFIPGIIKGNTNKEGHSFLQIVDGINHQSYYIKYDKNQFQAKKDQFYIELNKNVFTLHGIKLNHYDEDLKVIGDLKFIEMTKWPSTKLNPGSMGYYNYIQFMECYSQVCCLDANVIGKLLINETEVDFTGGKVYIEKNWGSKFPQAYTWVQCNNFHNNAALSVSIGKIPFWFTSFNGFLVAFKNGTKIYKFTTMNHSKMNIDIHTNNVNLSFEKDNLRLSIETRCHDDEFLYIKGPDIGKMDIVVKESIDSEIHVELMDLEKEVMLFQGIGKKSGIEFFGNLRDLQK